jgi:uncharacterized protein YbjT (DUF2867 family)
MGVTNVQHVPIGGVPELERIPAAPTQDIDVLFIGTLVERRLALIQQLRDAGLKAQIHTDIWGAARDAMYARAKIVLNVHVHEQGPEILEVVRVSYLLANGLFVVSESCANADEREEFSAAVAFADYEKIVETCQYYLSNPSARAARIEAGRAIMRSRPATRYLDTALTKLPPAPGRQFDPGR